MLQEVTCDLRATVVASKMKRRPALVILDVDEVVGSNVRK